MARLFDEHKKRDVKSLSGTWQMAKDESNKGRSESCQNGLNGAHTVTVPSVWNCEIDMLTYEGAVWYEKKFHTEGGTLRFSFGSVMTHAEVYLDGELLGSHYGGFIRFDFIKENVIAGDHRLTVRADNSFDRAAIPQPLVDWYHYGGITRPVELEVLRGMTVLSNRMDYTLSGDEADVRYTVELYNASDTVITDTVSITLGESNTVSESVTLGVREKKTVVIDGGRIANIERWSPEHPKLYSLITETSSDDLIDRTGFRLVEVKNRAIYLNGKKIRLRGINRHEEHPDFGMAFPEALMHRDIDIIKRAGCNAIRGSHYPNNPVFVDLLDEHGLTFWSEIPIWGIGFSAELISDPEVIERGLNMHREMVKEYYNHPSIIIWGMHNEIASDTEEGVNITKIYYDFLKENGGNRLVTYATNRMNRDISFNYTDLICFNSYVDWYSMGGFPSWEAYADAMEEYLQKIGVADKPVITSEFGAAAIYGHHTFDGLKWTEEYQAKNIADCIKLFFSRKEYAGTYVWHFADIRTAEEMGLDRARSYNNKGLVNEYRRPKMAYFAVSDIYNALKKEDENK